MEKFLNGMFYIIFLPLVIIIVIVKELNNLMEMLENGLCKLRRNLIKLLTKKK